MKKNKISAIFIALMALFLSSNPVFATVTGPSADGVQGLLESGTVTDFAKYAPISTIRIDLSKNTGIELDQASPKSGNPNGYYLDSNGYVKADGVQMKENFTTLSSFTIIYKDAATLSNGEKRNVEIVFGSGQDSQVIGKSGNGSYTDNLTFANVNSIVHNGPAITPLSSARKHFGFRTNVKVRVGKDGDFPDDTFLFTVFDININRAGNSNFESLVYAGSNYNYSEAVEPSSGLNSESDFYIPETYAENRVSKNSASPSSTYGIRFVGKNGNVPISQKNYNSGFAAVGSSNGFVARYWSSAGSNTSPIELYLMPDRISHTSTSVSGNNGMIELWTSGVVDDTAATQLDGGWIGDTRTYVVPNGKEVTYKMSPDAGYELDTLTVNGVAATATEALDANGEVLYYTYTFDGSATTPQEILVTWKKIAGNPTEQPKPGTGSEPAVPNTGGNTELGGHSGDLSGLLAFCQITGIIAVALPSFIRYRAFRKRRQS